MNVYSVGFAFDEAGKRVVLIQKNRPRWQRGLLNGIGGHIEDGETPQAAQAREFFEETGVRTIPSQWTKFAFLHSGEDFALTAFYLFSNEISYVDSVTDERVGIYNVADLHSLPVISNLTWLIPAALDRNQMGYFSTMDVDHPTKIQP